MIILVISFLAVWIVHKKFGVVNIYNPFVFSFLNHLLFLFIALSYHQIYHHIDISNFSISLIVSSFITMILGGVIALVITRRLVDKFTLMKLFVKGVSSDYSKIYLWIAIIFLFLGVAFAVYFTLKVGRILLFESDIENARIELRRGNGLVTVLSIQFLSYGLIMLEFFKIKQLYRIVAFVVACLCILNFGNRGPLLFLVVFVFSTRMFIRGKGINLVWVGFFFIFIFSTMVLLGALRSNYDASLWALFESRFGWRPYVNIQNLQTVIDHFPIKRDFLMGETYWVDFQMLLPGSHPNSGLFLKELMNMNFDGGSITPTYLGYLYLNFGKVLPFVMPFLYGFLSYLAYVIIVLKTNFNQPIRFINLLMFSSMVGAIVISGVATSFIQNAPILIIVNMVYFLLRFLLRSLFNN